MFDSSDYPQSLNEALFESWLEEGRSKKISYNYLLIIWNAFEEKYLPVYVEDRSEFNSFEFYPNNSREEGLIAVYDLYSGSRVALDNR
ncbi:hypothetical protein KZP23_18000 [Echinicola marina]|uniref:hypothetical protein n=1 Tax=Echinicola marina TaxID=2859768 RepID=UPI001CF686B0|nr:hypothetical protein [Echinicola marina]UCS92566.1 hypothetical protein KZP23_18000 [Echinicola marina]